jgi:hypothetical protein
MGEEESKKDEMEVLFPEIAVSGVKLKPWTYRQFTALLPWFRELKTQFKEKGIKKDYLKELFDKPDEKIDEILDLLGLVFPIIPELVVRTTGDELDTVLDWEFDKTLKVALLIILQNMGRIKNLSGLAREMRSLAA